MSGFFVTGSDAAQAEADAFDLGPVQPKAAGMFDGLGPRVVQAGRQIPNRLGIAVNQTFNWLATADERMAAARRYGPNVTQDQLLAANREAPEDEDWFEKLTRTNVDFYDSHRRGTAAAGPDPATVGMASELTGGLLEMLGLAISASGGGPAAVMPALGVGMSEPTRRDLVREGVDEKVALGTATREGLFYAAMGVLPAAVPSSASTLTRRVIERGITGAGINFATGLGMRYSMNSYLAANGYEEIAKRYEPLDTTSVATDVILGAAFGGLLGPRSGPRTRPRTEADGPALDGEPENGPMPWNADDYHTSAREHAQAGNLAEAYADATIAEERGAEGAAETRRMILEEIAQREDADAIEMQAARALEVARMEDAEANFDVKSADEVAAALIMEGERRAAMEEHPGIPLDGNAARAHARAMEQAEAQASRDEDIDVTGTGVETADFLPRPDDIEIMAMDVEQALAALAGDQPKTLTQWVRSQGGIADDRGDLAPLMQGKRGFASILRRTGRSVDDLALAAWEQGWFPELVERPTVNEFLDAIAGEDKGSIRTADVGRVSEIRDAQQVINYYESKGVDTSLEGEALREAIRANMVGREEEAFDALAEVLRDAGYSDLVGEVERLRALAAEQGQPINPDDIAFSMGMERFRDSRLSDQENKAVEMLRNGFDRASIADELDISNDQLRVVLAKARKKAPDVNIERQAGGRPNFQLARIRSLVSKGIPDAAIAERLGITLGNVRTAKWKLRAKGDFFASMGRSPVFRSAVETAISGEKAPKKGDASAWMSFLRNASGVKKEELDWIGLEDFLKAKGGSVSREEVLSFVKANGVRVEETVFQGGEARVAALQQELLPKIEERDRLYAQQEAIEQRIQEQDRVGRNDAYNALLAERTALEDRLIDLSADITGLLRRIGDTKESGDGTKWSSYTLPGGENYRELLLRLPVERALAFDPAKVSFEKKSLSATQGSVKVSYDGRDLGTFDLFTRDEAGERGAFGQSINPQRPRTDDEIINIARQYYEKGNKHMGIKPLREGTYTSSHWDEPNVLAHIRFKERTDADGRRILAIEEVQSDWHQAGREKGYKKEVEPSQVRVERDGFGVDVFGPREGQHERLGPSYTSHEDAYLQEQFAKRWSGEGVPDAPFKDNKWAALSLKRMIRWAAENGFDAVSWIPGDVAVERFGLEKVIDSLQYKKTNAGWAIQLRTVDGRAIPMSVTDANLESTVGAEVAARIRADKGKYDGLPLYKALTGLDLKMGGEGMRAFYDKILPNIANDIGKKYGARVGETTIDTTVSSIHAYPSGETWRIGDRSRGGGPVENTPTFKTKEAAEAWIAENMNRKTLHTLPLTDALREAASEGLPLFSRGGGQGVEASLLTARLLRYFGGDFTKLVESAQVKIVDGVDDVPGLREKLNELGTIGEPGAVHDYRNKTTYMIAANVDPQRAVGVFLHEVGVHHGMADMLGDRRFAQLAKQVARLVDAGHPIAKEARTQAELFALRPEQIEEETLAYLVENAPDLPVVRRIIADIRQWLWKTFGADFGMNLTADDIRQLAVSSLRRVAREAVRKDMGFEVMGEAAASLRVTDLPDPASRAAWAKANVLSDAIPGEAKTARQYGFGLSTGDTVVMSVAPEPDTGAAAVEWTFADTLVSRADPYAATGKTNVLAEILPRVVAALESDAAQFDRDAYVFTPATPAHARVYKAALRQFGSAKYAIMEVDGDIYLIHQEADLGQDGKILPRPGREGEVVEWDDGADADTRQQAFFDALSAKLKADAGGTGGASGRSGGSDGGGFLASFKRNPDPAKQAMEDDPGMRIATPDGVRPAADILMDAEEAVKAAREMQEGFAAAASCAAQIGTGAATRGASRAFAALATGNAIGATAALPLGMVAAPFLAEDNRRQIRNRLVPQRFKPTFGEAYYPDEAMSGASYTTEDTFYRGSERHGTESRAADYDMGGANRFEGGAYVPPADAPTEEDQ